jgi:uncharacterized membrane protein
MKRLRRLLSGQILVLTTLAMVAIIGFAALVVDIGFMYSARRRMQTAADAAAVAGATALRDGQSVTASAKNGSSINGFTDGQSNVTVTVNNPPGGRHVCRECQLCRGDRKATDVHLFPQRARVQFA